MYTGCVSQAIVSTNEVWALLIPYQTFWHSLFFWWLICAMSCLYSAERKAVTILWYFRVFLFRFSRRQTKTRKSLTLSHFPSAGHQAKTQKFDNVTSLSYPRVFVGRPAVHLQYSWCYQNAKNINFSHRWILYFKHYSNKYIICQFNGWMKYCLHSWLISWLTNEDLEQRSTCT
jgi:hypothetical protein